MQEPDAEQEQETKAFESGSDEDNDSNKEDNKEGDNSNKEDGGKDGGDDSSDDDNSDGSDGVVVDDNSDDDSNYTDDEDEDEGEEKLTAYTSRTSPFGTKHQLHKNRYKISYKDLYDNYRPRARRGVGKWASLSCKSHI